MHSLDSLLLWRRWWSTIVRASRNTVAIAQAMFLLIGNNKNSSLSDRRSLKRRVASQYMDVSEGINLYTLMARHRPAQTGWTNSPKNHV